jgi:23S rRNA (cytosine1962-C5)-methyltransferase
MISNKPNRIAFKLKPSAERMVKKGHPWVFEDSIIKQNKSAKTGDIAVIFDSNKNKFLALGLYDEKSVIKIKCLQFHKQSELDQEFFFEKINDAFQKRISLLSEETNSFRLIYGESDFLPSLIIDVYNKTVVIKLYSLIWKNYLSIIIEAVKKLIEVNNIVLRLARNIQPSAKEINLIDGQILFGKLESGNIIFKENNIKFYADVINGHKTGFFLDQRKNRKKVGLLAKNKNCLDVFSFNGGFTLNCMYNNSKEVTSIDISQFALDSISENIKLNEFKNKHISICGDAFEILNNLIKQNKNYDLVIIDPPSFAKKESEITKAKEQYIRLSQLGSKLVNQNGILVLASCSSRVSAEEFFECNKIGFKKNQVKYEMIESTYHDIDHPVHIPEMDYLKCGYYRIG